MPKQNFALHFCLLLTANLFWPACLQASELPKDLEYLGKPIEAICIYHLSLGDSSRLEPYSLKKCMLDKKQITVTDPVYHEQAAKGFLGYSFKYSDDLTMSQPYCYWKYISTLKEHEYLLWTQTSGGGTGHFSNLFVLARKNDTIQNILELAGGDRASGGIIDVTYHDKVLTIEQRATPREIFQICLEKLNPPKKLPDDSYLPDCAICDGGTVVRQGDIANPKIVQIKLNAQTTPDFNDANSTLMSNYYNAHKARIASGNLTLDENGMKQFAQAVLEGH